MDPDDKMDVDEPQNDGRSQGTVPAMDVDTTPDSQPTVTDHDAHEASRSSPPPDPEPPSSSSLPANLPPNAGFPPTRRPNNWERREIARTTIAAIDEGQFELDGQIYHLEPTREALVEGTVYYDPTELAGWKELSREASGGRFNTEVEIVQCSTLEGCWQMHETLGALDGEVDKRIGVLNFASARKPGGGFLSGAQAQEETIARSSTLYASLMLNTAQQFYDLHHAGPKDGYYTHAMIYSPHVHIFRNDAGDWHPPYEVDILTSPAVNAGDVRRKSHWRNSNAVERDIEHAMKERMARLLYLFEKQGVKNLVLGSFGTGVFRNSVELVAKLWIELLVAEGSRFKQSFERVVFAIIDTPTVTKFRDVFSGKKDSDDERTASKRRKNVGRAQVPRVDDGADSVALGPQTVVDAATTQGQPPAAGAEAQTVVEPAVDAHLQDQQVAIETERQRLREVNIDDEPQEPQVATDTRTSESGAAPEVESQETNPVGDAEPQESRKGASEPETPEVSPRKDESRL